MCHFGDDLPSKNESFQPITWLELKTKSNCNQVTKKRINNILYKELLTLTQETKLNETKA